MVVLYHKCFWIILVWFNERSNPYLCWRVSVMWTMSLSVYICHMHWNLRPSAPPQCPLVTIYSIGFCRYNCSFYFFWWVEGEGRGGGEGEICNILFAINGKSSDSEAIIRSCLKLWSSLDRHDFANVHACRFIQCPFVFIYSIIIVIICTFKNIFNAFRSFCYVSCSVCEMWYEI